MASKEERFALFRQQTQQLLTVEEAKQVKASLAVFLNTKNVDELVDSLDQVLTTPEKQKLFPSISTFIPPQHHDEYVQLYEAILEDGEMFEPVDEPADLQEVDEQQLHEFDLAIKMAEASLCEPEEEEEEVDFGLGFTVRKSSMSTTDAPAKKGTIQRGFKFKSFKNPADAPTRQLDDPKNAAVHRATRPSAPLFTNFIASASSRGEANTMLTEGGFTEGLYLVRPKDLSTGSSVKLRPGQKMPYRAYVLSFVSEGKVQHQLIDQAEKNGPITIGGKPTKATSLPDLLQFLTEMAGYELVETPFHCHGWYHGQIDRNEAVSRLAAYGDSGTFLVRKSTKEEDTYVISMWDQGRDFHNKVIMRRGLWATAVTPDATHATLVDLIEFHKQTSGGLPTLLAQECVRPQQKKGRSLGGLRRKDSMA